MLKKVFFFISVADRCLSFEYAIGNYELKYSLTELNVYVEGTGKSKTRVKHVWTTDYSWKTEMVSIKAIDNLVVMTTFKIVSNFEVSIYILELFSSYWPQSNGGDFVSYLQISIEGVIGYQIIGVDNIALRPGLCKYMHFFSFSCTKFVRYSTFLSMSFDVILFAQRYHKLIS